MFNNKNHLEWTTKQSMRLTRGDPYTPSEHDIKSDMDGYTKLHLNFGIFAQTKYKPVEFETPPDVPVVTVDPEDIEEGIHIGKLNLTFGITTTLYMPVFLPAVEERMIVAITDDVLYDKQPDAQELGTATTLTINATTLTQPIIEPPVGDENEAVRDSIKYMMHNEVKGEAKTDITPVASEVMATATTFSILGQQGYQTAIDLDQDSLDAQFTSSKFALTTTRTKTPLKAIADAVSSEQTVIYGGYDIEGTTGLPELLMKFRMTGKQADVNIFKACEAVINKYEVFHPADIQANADVGSSVSSLTIERQLTLLREINNTTVSNFGMFVEYVNLRPDPIDFKDLLNSIDSHTIDVTAVKYLNPALEDTALTGVTVSTEVTELDNVNENSSFSKTIVTAEVTELDNVNENLASSAIIIETEMTVVANAGEVTATTDVLVTAEIEPIPVIHEYIVKHNAGRFNFYWNGHGGDYHWTLSDGTVVNNSRPNKTLPAGESILYLENGFDFSTGIMSSSDASSILTGSLADIPNSYSGYIGFNGALHVTGSMADLPRACASKIALNNCTSIVGDLADLPPLAWGLLLDYTPGIHGAIPVDNNIRDVYGDYCSLSKEDIEQSLINISLNSQYNGNLTFKGTCPHIDDATALAAVSTLRNRGFTIKHN